MTSRIAVALALLATTLAGCTVPSATAGEPPAGATAPPDGGTAAPKPQKAKNVPFAAFDSQLMAAPTPHLPDRVKKEHRKGPLIWMAKACAGLDGAIDQVSILEGIPGADESITSTLRSWRLRPQAMPICTMIRFVFEF